MTKKISALLLTISFIFYCSLARAGQALFLEPLLKEAQAKNPKILAAKKRWEASKIRIPQAKSLEAPKAGFSVMKIPRGTLKFDKAMPNDRMLSVSQMFPLFGKLSLKAKMAVIESQMAAADYKGAELEVIKEVKNAFYELFMNYEEIELNKQSLKLLGGIAKAAEARYVTGDLAQEELFKLHSEIAGLITRIINLEEENKAKKTRLNTLLNRDPESPLGIPKLPEGLAEEKDIRYLYRLTVENQPELLIFSYAIEKNKYAEDLARRGLLPDLMAELGQRGITGGGFGPWDLMLSFTVPFWFWTKQRHEIKEAIVNLDGAKAAYEAMKNAALKRTKELAVKAEVSKNKIYLYRDNLLPLIEGSVESSLAGFRSGRGDFMMLLDSERMLIETKMSYYRALSEYNMNLSDLERAVGKDLSEVKDD